MTNTAAAVISVTGSLLIMVLRIDNSAISNYDATKMLVVKAQSNKLLTSGVGRRVH